MSRSGYFDFLHGAQEAFGLNWSEAQELYRETQEAIGFAPSELGRDALVDYFDIIDTLAERFFERPDFEELPEVRHSPYELDPSWPDDVWLEAESWFEISGEYEG